MGLFSKGKKQAPVAEAPVEVVSEVIAEEIVVVEEVVAVEEPAVTVIYPGNVSEAEVPAAPEPEVPEVPAAPVAEVKVGLSKEEAVRLFGEPSHLYI